MRVILFVVAAVLALSGTACDENQRAKIICLINGTPCPGAAVK